MIDLQTLEDAYQSFEVNDVALIGSKFNIADRLTKVKENFSLIDTIKLPKSLIQKNSG